MNFDVHCLSLPRCHDRRAKFQQQAARAGLSFVYSDGPDAQQLPAGRLLELADQTLAKSRIGRPLALGEIACAEGHRQIYRRLAEASLDAAVILEDDVSLDERFCAVLRGLQRWDLDLATRRVLVLLGGPWIKRLPLLVSRRHAVQVTAGHRLLRVLRSQNALHGTYGYLISRPAATALLEREPRIGAPADSWDLFWRAGVFQEIWLLEPQIVFHAAGDRQDSLILAERLELDQEKIRQSRRLSVRLRRLGLTLASPRRLVGSIGARLGWDRIKRLIFDIWSHFC